MQTDIPLSHDILIGQGSLVGSPRDERGVLAFKGIPFAQAPIGPLRWRPPVRHGGWTGTRSATEFAPRAFGPPCLNPAVNDMPMSEDCLFLDIWTPARSAGERLPVMVWIHGGGFQTGASAEPNHSGHMLAAKGVVVVSINYRLGVFGFMAHPELDLEGPHSGNYGLLDQISALEWVRENIADFGGDPDRVTIFGESAGAASVAFLTASPLSRGLIHRAIGESGGFWEGRFGSLSSHDDALAKGTALTERAGVNIAGLRALPPETLHELAPWKMPHDPVTRGFSPSVDGYVLPDHPLVIYREGRQNCVPLLAGWNDAEGRTFAFWAPPRDTTAALKDAVRELYGHEDMDRFDLAYPSATEQQREQAALRWIGDQTISEQVWQWLRSHQNTSGCAVYGYQFDVVSGYTPSPVHTAEIDYVFATLERHQLGAGSAAPDQRDHEIADQMSRYWVNFAATGNPNGEGLPDWPLYSSASPTVMRFTYERTAADPETGSAGFELIGSHRSDGRFPAAWQQVGAGSSSRSA
jgi:para-nitrobenzyl esterase